MKNCTDLNLCKVVYIYQNSIICQILELIYWMVSILFLMAWHMQATKSCRQKLLRTSQKNRNKGKCCDWCISIQFCFSFVFILLSSLCPRINYMLVLNFSMKLKSVYTTQNCKIFIQYFYRISQQRNATETKFLYLRFLRNNKVSTSLTNTANFFFANAPWKLLF